VSAGAPTVLLVEDDDGHAALVRRNLGRAGIGGEPIRLHDGQQLLDYLYRRLTWVDRPPHAALVVLLDLNMPRLNGFDVLETLKTDRLFGHIPVVVLTTTDNPVEIDRCYTLGAAACLVKPVDYGAFGDMVRQLAGFLLVICGPDEVPAASLRDDL
jgi:CheY-like chemotaxis protein